MKIVGWVVCDIYMCCVCFVGVLSYLTQVTCCLQDICLFCWSSSLTMVWANSRWLCQPILAKIYVIIGLFIWFVYLLFIWFVYLFGLFVLILIVYLLVVVWTYIGRWWSASRWQNLSSDLNATNHQCRRPFFKKHVFY